MYAAAAHIQLRIARRAAEEGPVICTLTLQAAFATSGVHLTRCPAHFRCAESSWQYRRCFVPSQGAVILHQSARMHSDRMLLRRWLSAFLASH